MAFRGAGRRILSYEKGVFELIKRINRFFKAEGLSPLVTEVAERREKNRAKLKDTAEKVVTAFGEAPVRIGQREKDVVVFDADLSADCGLRPLKPRVSRPFYRKRHSGAGHGFNRRRARA